MDLKIVLAYSPRYSYHTADDFVSWIQSLKSIEFRSLTSSTTKKRSILLLVVLVVLFQGGVHGNGIHSFKYIFLIFISQGTH